MLSLLIIPTNPDQILIGPSYFHRRTRTRSVVAALTPHHQLCASIFTRLIGKRDQNQSNVSLQVDYDNSATLLIIITLQTCAKGRLVYKSQIPTRRGLSLGNLLFPSMSRRKQPHPKHIENEQQVASFLDNNGTSAVSPKLGFGDAHVCGKCKAEFVDLAEFLSHKKCCIQQDTVCSEEEGRDQDGEAGSPDHRELQEGESLLTDTTTTTTTTVDLSAATEQTRDTADVIVDPTLEQLKQERKDEIENELGSLNEDVDDIDEDEEVDDIEDDDEDFDDVGKLSSIGHPFGEEQIIHANPHLQHLYAISTSTASKLGLAETIATSSRSLNRNTMRMSPEPCSTDKHSPILNGGGGTDKDTTASAYDLNGADFLHLDDGRKLTPELPSSQLPHFPVPYSSALMNGAGGNVIIEPLSETRAAVAQFAEANSISPSDMANLRASIYGLQQQATAFIQCVNMFEERFMSFASSFGEGAAAAAAGLHLPNGPASLSPSLASASTGVAPSGLPAIMGSGLNAAGQSPLDGSAGSMDLVTTTVNCSMRQTAVVSKAGGIPHSPHSGVPLGYPQTLISSTGQHHPHSQSHLTNQLHSNLTSLTSSHSSTMDYHPYQGLVHHPSFGHAHGFRHKCKYCQKVFSNELSLQVHMRSHTGERPYRCNVCNIKFSCKSALRVHFAKHKSHLQLPQQPLPAHSAARNAALLSSRFPFQPMSLAMSSVAVSLPAAGVPITATASPTVLSRAPLLDAASASISQSLIREGERSPSLKLEKQEPKLGEGATDSVSLHATNNNHNNNYNNGLTHSSTSGFTGAEPPTSVFSAIGLPTSLSAPGPHPDPSSVIAAITASNSSFAAAACSPAITTTSSASHIPLSATRHFPLLPPLTVVPHPPLGHHLPPHFNTSGHGPPPPHPPPPPLNKPDLRSMPGGLFPPAKHIEPGENVEDYMEVNTSETSKLQKFVENIEHKLSDPNECAICHRVLSCKSALQMHYRIHTGERPFRCKLCGRAFTTRGNLKTHMGVHRAKPPTRLTHQCPVCHKQFTNILVLQQHIRGHTSDTYPSMPPSLYRASEWHPKPFDLRPHLEPRELDLSKTAPSFSHHPALPSTNSPSMSLNSTSPAISPMDNSIKISPGSLDMTQKVLDATGSIGGSDDRHLMDDENSLIDDSGVMDGGMMDDEGMMDDSVMDSDAADDGVMDTSVMDDSNMMDGSLADSNVMDTDDLDGERLSLKERKIEGDETKVDDWIESKTPPTPTSASATPVAATLLAKKEEDWPEGEDSQASSDAAHEALLDEDRPNSMASIGSHESPELHKIHSMNPMSSYESHINSVITSGFVPPSSASLAALEARVRAINSNNPLSMTVSPKFDLRLHPRDLNSIHHKQFSPHLPHSAFLNGDGSTGTSPHSLDALSDSNGLRDAASMHLRHDVPGFPMSSVFPLAPALDLRPRNVEGRASTTCYICFKTFACKSALDIHIRSHTKERPFKCEVCDRSFSTRGNMGQHMLTHKIRDLPSQFNSRNGSSSSSQNENSPSNTAPSNSANTGPASSGETQVKSEQSGESEASRVAPSLGAPNSSGSGNGNGSSTSSSSSSNLNSSSKPPGTGETSELANNPITPTHQSQISQLQQLQQLHQQQQQPPPQTSPISDGNSTSPFVRRSSPKHTCSVCQKQFSGASALQIHIRTHTGDKPFKCNMCAKAFTTKGNLKVHMGTHMWGNNPSRRGRRMSIEPPFLIGPKEQHYLSPYHRSPDFLFHQYPHFLNGLSPKMNEISVIQSLNGSMNHLQNHLSEVSKEEPPRSDSVGGRSSIESDRKSTESLPSSWPSDALQGLNLAHHHQQQAQAALILSQQHHQQQQLQQQQHQQQQQQQLHSPNGSSNSSHSSGNNNNSIAVPNLEGGGLIAGGLGLGGGVAPSSHDLLLASGLSGGELDLSMKPAPTSISQQVVSGPGTGVNTALGANGGPAGGASGNPSVSGGNGGSSAVSTADSTASSPPAAPPSVSPPPPASASTPNSDRGDRDLVSGGGGGTPSTPTSAPDTPHVGGWSWRTICHVCNQVFPTSSSLDHHLRTHHHGNPTEEPLRTSVSN